MAPLLLYAICALGAAGLYLMLRPGAHAVRGAGAVLGLAALVWLGKEAAAALAGPDGGGWGWWGDDSPLLFGLFSLIAVAGAVRMVTHQRPVYAALYFVLVVLASAALFLMLEAEFMAFALIIVYAGAILITYLFVLMLAQQAQSEEDIRTLAEYDRTPREPAAAVIVGFILVAVLADGLFGVRKGDAPGAPRGSLAALSQASPAEIVDAIDRSWRDLEAMPRVRDAAIRAEAPFAREILAGPDGRVLTIEDGRAVARVVDSEGQTRAVELPPGARPTNTQRIGLALVAEFPVSLELAGVILTMAMFGAVILARRQAELGEDQRREAAGMARFSMHGDDDERADRFAGEGSP